MLASRIGVVSGGKSPSRMLLEQEDILREIWLVHPARLSRSSNRHSVGPCSQYVSAAKDLLKKKQQR